VKLGANERVNLNSAGFAKCVSIPLMVLLTTLAVRV